MSQAISYKEMIVYKHAYQLALDIFIITKNFPQDERYLLVSQIRRSSRSICANIAEAYRKRRYPKHFISKLSDADSEASETLIWLDFSNDLGYIDKNQHTKLTNRYIVVGRMLGGMMKSPEKFMPRTF